MACRLVASSVGDLNDHRFYDFRWSFIHIKKLGSHAIKLLVLLIFLKIQQDKGAAETITKWTIYLVLSTKINFCKDFTS